MVVKTLTRICSILIISLVSRSASAVCNSRVSHGSAECELDGMQLLQRQVQKVQRHVQKEKVPGMVDAMYTFGAPAASANPLPNLQNKEGHYFGGLRTYTETKLSGGGKLVDAAAKFDVYPHARIATLALDWEQDSLYVSGGGDPAWPKHGAVNWGLHKQHQYAPRLAKVKVNGTDVADQEPFATANKMVALAWAAYEKVEKVQQTIKEELPGWRLVERRVFESGIGGDGSYDDDPVLLVQEADSLDCALVFTGTDTFGELFTSANVRETPFCGFPSVHAGYNNEVTSLTKHTLWSAMKAKLPKCNHVMCVGHSLGGAMCDVFSACANSGHTNNDEYKRLTWYKEKPELMPELGSQSNLGTVSELYTYGSPAVANPPLRNPLSEDGCFQGLRVYTEDDVAASKSVDAEVLNVNTYPQVNSPVLALHWNSESHFRPCNKKDTISWPGQGAENWGLHAEKNYEDRLAALVKKNPDNDLYAKSNKFAALTFSADKPLKFVKIIMSKTLQNWNLVEHVSLGNDKEPALLAQSTESLECVLVLPGSNAWRTKNYATNFCGLDKVHAGYRNELNNLAQSEDWIKITDKLSKCESVTCAGNGKGGSLCTLFAACVNSGNQHDQDFRRLIWTKGTPEALPSV
eukprot:TRINITY_DN1082_c1_g3_i1.p1 TRINITY_DN1082_c1_g3~~TRINITY_DN1082_c1_g3_i1.p1  ORF type:complete len:634 (+),score=106.89 TRINITY_DN1082_c1_g3_i1:156-2057(+)